MNANEHRPPVCIVTEDETTFRAIEAILEPLDVEVRLFRSSEQFRSFYESGRVACLLLDLFFPNGSALNLMRDLREDCTLVSIVISREPTVATAVEAMKSGAIEFFEQPFDADALRSTVEKAIAVHQRRSQLSVARKNGQQRLGQLSDEEYAVLNEASTGATVKAIANRLDISVRTVHMRISNALKKTHTANKFELLKMICFEDILKQAESCVVR